MDRIWTAFRAFFAVLFNREAFTRIRQALTEETVDVPPPIPFPTLPIEPPPPVTRRQTQSEAITLLATLQREARLVDFLQENLGSYSDDQVGAAVREIHRESAAVLDRLFAIKPILMDDE